VVNADLRLVEGQIEALLQEFPPSSTSWQSFLGAQFDRGLAWVHFGEGSGGLGLSASLQPVINARLEAAGAPNPFRRNLVGVGQSAAAIHAHGTSVQKHRFLRKAWTCEELWCQLFSEPGAGSDLAGLATMAVRDGEEWVVNGQKVWSSAARDARWAILLARTDPHVPKHRGLTFFVCDMTAAGVEVRPIRQADGNQHFNEVFLDGVRLPDDLRIGDAGRGWGVSLTSLSSEREAAGNMEPPIAVAWRLWEQRSDKTSAGAQVLRQRLAGAWIEARVGEYTERRLRAAQGRAGAGSDGSIGKLRRTLIHELVGELCVDILGAEGTLGGDYRGSGGNPRDVGDATPQMFFIRTRSNAIMGGTTQIQKNILAERLLGLPKDARGDVDIPWSETVRSVRG
jgi:alkylation response protein AidB-like acyl-CoA dehydrogenase